MFVRLSLLLLAKPFIQHLQRPSVLAEAHLVRSDALRPVLLPTAGAFVAGFVGPDRSGHTASVGIAVGVARRTRAVSILLSSRAVHERADAWNCGGLGRSPRVVSGGVACTLGFWRVRRRALGVRVGLGLLVVMW